MHAMFCLEWSLSTFAQNEIPWPIGSSYDIVRYEDKHIMSGVKEINIRIEFRLELRKNGYNLNIKIHC
jgi:hypothetical protein